ncbi:hypothetical protein [Umezawaea sp. Da 62-37]|uniref:hypothetical protein n=1 Tax=Umezawaea sp. Da 62-37 TaxID=3075927 RepID=UPI0028F6EDA0|nr:hypothetical protein [Umezawaea sp. Da 62-37]WNV85453.1 hypothetical protein RM788_46270 [Umezawaea sp. Da 62-37]
MTPQHRRLAVVIAFVVAALAAGVLGALLELATDLWWTRYVPMVVVAAVAVVAVLRLDLFGLRK